MCPFSISALSVLLLTAAAYAEDPVSWRRDFDEPTPIINAIPSSSRNDQTAYRLPQTVFPLEYNIYVDLYFAENTERPFSYDGRAVILIQPSVADVTEIVLHANVDRIRQISVLDEFGSPVNLILQNPFNIEPQYHFLKINMAQPLVLGLNYTLDITYRKTMNDGPMKRGIWKGYYTDANGDERIYAATHFQPYSARQAFPCWDEPFFKAEFTLHLSAPRSYGKIYSNTELSTFDNLENDRHRYNFKTTPKMSSYLVTFLVSESFEVIAIDTTFDPPIRIIGRSNTMGLGDHALNLTVRMTDHFDQYFDRPYSTLHPNLLNDHISSPDWASAGTENWGMVSYRELYLILSPEETTMAIEHYAATLVSHELAHKWFGNLITCHWWSETWINEGFASYFGYMATVEMFPQYAHHEHFNSRYLQNSLNFDSGTGTVPLNHEVNTPAQVTGHFGTISYSKGASFLRMTANLISPRTFRKACQIFLNENAFEPTDQTHLHDAFVDAIDAVEGSLAGFTNFNFSDYYYTWVNSPGYPILTVTVDHSTGVMSLTQERFFINPSATPSDLIYSIPITYSTKRKPDFTNLTPSHMMTSDKEVLDKDPGEEWVIFNNLQEGHYRVTYDERTWELITEALLENPSPIHYMNRGQIVDDVFALMRSEKMAYKYGFNILKFLHHEENYHVWEPAITGYTWIRNRFRAIPDVQAEFDDIILSSMEYIIETVGFEGVPDESPTDIMRREDVLHFACTLGHEKCIEESRKRFIEFRDNGVWVDPKIRRNVFVVGIREGESNDFNFLLNRFHQSNFANDQLEMLRALAATRDPQLLTRYLELTLSKAVRSHDKVNAFNYALLGNPENAYTVLQFVKNNIDAIRIAYVEDSPPNPVHTALSNLAAYLDESGLVEMEEWLSTQIHLPQHQTALAAIASARSNNAWGVEMASTILAAARDNSYVSSASTTIVIALTFITMFM